jgi:hypothetical protein
MPLVQGDSEDQERDKTLRKAGEDYLLAQSVVGLSVSQGAAGVQGNHGKPGVRDEDDLGGEIKGRLPE